MVFCIKLTKLFYVYDWVKLVEENTPHPKIKNHTASFFANMFKSFKSRTQDVRINRLSRNVYVTVGARYFQASSVRRSAAFFGIRPQLILATPKSGV